MCALENAYDPEVIHIVIMEKRGNYNKWEIPGGINYELSLRLKL
jgi:hypothetical protein